MLKHDAIWVFGLKSVQFSVSLSKTSAVVFGLVLRPKLLVSEPLLNPHIPIDEGEVLSNVSRPFDGTSSYQCCSPSALNGDVPRTCSANHPGMSSEQLPPCRGGRSHHWPSLISLILFQLAFTTVPKRVFGIHV